MVRIQKNKRIETIKNTTLLRKIKVDFFNCHI